MWDDDHLEDGTTECVRSILKLKTDKVSLQQKEALKGLIRSRLNGSARLLRTVSQPSLYRDMIFSSLGHYSVERLGISRRNAYELVWLGRRFSIIFSTPGSPSHRRSYGRIFTTPTEVRA